jgi:hypothetical protein
VTVTAVEGDGIVVPTGLSSEMLSGKEKLAVRDKLFILVRVIFGLYWGID